METITLPEKSRTEWIIALALFFASCLYLRIFYRFVYLGNQDEGIILQGAARILQGEVLYRDFFSAYTPGSYYWMALLFRIFGMSILVGRAGLIIYGGIFSSFTYLLARRVAGRASSLLAAFLVTVICLPQRFIVLHNWDSTLWACLTLYCAVRVLEGGNADWIFATGSLSAITCLFGQPTGAGLALGLGIGFVILRMRKGGSSIAWTPRKVVALTIGFCWPLIGMFIYFGLNNALGDMAKAMRTPFTHDWTFAHVPYGFLPWWPAALGAITKGAWGQRLLALLAFSPYLLAIVSPPVMIGVLLFRGWRLCRDPETGRRTEYYVLVSAVGFGLFFVLFATHRPDLGHIEFLAPITLLPIAWVFGDMNRPMHRSGLLYPPVFSWIFASAIVCGIIPIFPCLNAHNRVLTARCLLYSEKPDEVVPYLRDHLAPGQNTLIYPYFPLYYFLTNTYNVGRYEWVQPGLHNREEISEVLRSLVKEQPGVVVFSPDSSEWLTIPYPNTPPQALAVSDPVADFIQVHYSPCAVLETDGPYHVVYMARKDLSCTARFGFGGGRPGRQ